MIRSWSVFVYDLPKIFNANHKKFTLGVIHFETKILRSLSKALSMRSVCVLFYFNSLLIFINLCHPNRLCPVSWGCRIHRLHLCRGVRPRPTSVLDMTLNNLMVRFQQCWSFGECGVSFYCHCSQVHSDPEW